MTDAPSLELLEAKSREELVAIATAAGIPIPPRTRKPGIIDAILGLADSGPNGAGPNGAGPNGADASPDTQMSASDASDGATGAGRKRTLTLPTNDSGQASNDSGSDGPDAGDSAGGNSDAGDSAGGNSGSSNSGAGDPDVAEEGNRRLRRRGRERDDQFQGEAAPCDGLLDLREEGYGFLRISGLLPSPDDVYVAARHVRQYRLRRGDRVTGASRPAARSEKNPALLRLDTINGAEPNADDSRPLFEDIAAIHSTNILPLLKDANGQLDDNAKQLLAQFDNAAPAGYGQRGLLVSASQASMTTLVETLSTAVGVSYPDVHLLVLLIDERPEQITELTRRLETYGEVIASALDRPAEEHVAMAELTLERAKRKAEQGEDVVVVFDGLTRLARAHRRTVNHRQSQITSESAAIASAKSLFGSARNLEQAGSVTMFATARSNTGSEFDVAALDEYRTAANLTWVLKDSEQAAGAPLVLDEDASSSSGNHI